MSDTTGITVDVSNTGQLQAWDGSEGEYWATHADEFDVGVDRYHQPLLDAAAISIEDRVLDIGCGTGQTTRDAARLAHAGSAFGIDLSSSMLEMARTRAAREDVHNVTFEQGDAQIYPFEAASFDVALSRTGSMFFGDPAAAHANIARALRPGGRMAFGVWQPASENEWFTSFTGALAAGRNLPGPPPDSPNPFAMSDPERVRPLLEATGFERINFSGLRAPMTFGATARDAHGYISGLLGWLVAELDEATRQEALDELLRTMQTHETPDGVQFDSAMWLITARRA